MKECKINRKLLLKKMFPLVFSSLIIFFVISMGFEGLFNNNVYGQSGTRQSNRKVPSPSSEINLKDIPYKIVYESYRETEGKENWEIILNDCNDSNQVNLTKTPDLDELYPHVSPDGTKICFVLDEGTTRRNKVRSVYYMNIDGTERVEVARNARQPCWSPDGKKIAYLKGEYENYNTSEYASAGLVIYDLESKKHQPHPNLYLIHMYAICWSPDGNWFLGVVHGNSQYSDAILAFEANGPGVYDLAMWGVKGCRPDFSKDGKQITWGETDWDLCVADFTVGPLGPIVSNIRQIANCRQNSKIYHVDFSPDSKYIIFSYGPSRGGQNVGGMAQGWDICIADLTGKWYKITNDGKHNKEPDWVPNIPSNEEELESETENK